MDSNDIDVSKAADNLIARTERQLRTDEAVLNIKPAASMTNHQDKELSSVIYEGWVAHAKRGGLLDAAGNATDSEKAQISWHSWEASHKQYATSPQLPVAEQPAGQAVIDYVTELIREAMTEEDESWEGENKYYANLALNGAFAKIEQKLKAYAAPHSPVAQMSGDSFANSLRKIFTIARNMDDDKVKETFHDHWQIWQDALASHPSNAAKHCDDSGQPYAPCTREDDAALSILAMLCTRMGIDQTLPADERAGKLSEMLAATVPQVAQSVPEGWKLVPVEPTDDMARAAIAAHFENKMQINGLNYWSAMLKAAPQPVAASPSIVPSDEQIKACAISVTRDIGRPYQDCTLAEWARKLAHALTTASNAGEAAQEPAEDSDTPHQEAEIVIEVSTLLDAPTLYTQVFIAARCMNGWPHDAATEAATIAVKEYGDDPCKEVAALRAVLDEVLRTDESGEAAQGDRQ